MAKNLSNHVTPQLALVAQALGSTTVESAEIEIEGHEGLMIWLTFGTVDPGDGNYLELSRSLDDGATWEDLPTTRAIPTLDGNVALLDCYQPLGSKFKVRVVRATATTTGELWVFKYAGRGSGMDHDPAEGFDVLFVQSPEPVGS